MQDQSDPPWHEDPQFWVGLRDGIFDEQLWANADSEIDQLLALVTLPKGAAVLDIPCGPGRHLLPLARRGFQLCGVDLSQAYLAEAQKRAADARVTIELILADMREFVRPESFELAICMYTSFGYSGDPQQDAKVLKNLYRSLRPGGRLVLELVTKETAVASGPHAYPVSEGRRIVEQAELMEHGAIIQRRWQLQGPGVDRSWLAWHRLYSVDELHTMLRRAGFSHSHLYGALDGRAFTPAGDGAVLIAER
jgi:SAM-dependent methyltransferase